MARIRVMWRSILSAKNCSGSSSATAKIRDKAQRRLESAIVWRELARRTGDAALLRKAASTAEMAAAAFDRTRRPDGWARARCEQAFCAMLGVGGCDRNLACPPS